MKTLADKLEEQADRLVPCDANFKFHAYMMGQMKKYQTRKVTNRKRPDTQTLKPSA